MKKEIKLLYRKDKNLAIKVAKTLGYKIVSKFKVQIKSKDIDDIITQLGTEFGEMQKRLTKSESDKKQKAVDLFKKVNGSFFDFRSDWDALYIWLKKTDL